MSKNKMWTADQILLVCDALADNDWRYLNDEQIHQVWRRLRGKRTHGAIGWESTHILAALGFEPVASSLPTPTEAYEALREVAGLYWKSPTMVRWVGKLREELDNEDWVEVEETVSA